MYYYIAYNNKISTTVLQVNSTNLHATFPYHKRQCDTGFFGDSVVAKQNDKDIYLCSSVIIYVF